MPRWLKTSLKILGSILILLLVVLIGLSIYVSNNKSKVLALINTELKKSFDGTVKIGDMSTSFFKSFPGVSLTLKDVLIRDKRWEEHHHTLLDAKDFDVSVNTAALLRGTISINHIDITNASVDIYTDSTGYSNTSVFKKGNKSKNKDHSNNSSSSPEIKKFNLKNVNLAINDKKNKKLFKFEVAELNGDINYPLSGWNGKVHMDLVSRSLGFNIDKGAFLKDKKITADLQADYNESTGKINIASDNFNIGGDDFKLHAMFTKTTKAMDFNFHITADEILWKHAAAIVAANISQTLYKFNFEKPISLDATIAGSFAGGGDPYLHVTSVIKDNRLIIPGAVIEGCSFNALFTNSYEKGKPLGDPNSIIKLTKFRGTYNHLPFTIDTGSIINLEKPIATGDFKSTFPLTTLNYTTDKIARFTNGTANINLRYKADVINLRLTKPVVGGDISFKNADVTYLPKKLLVKNSSIALHFVGSNLILNNIRLQVGRSIVFMNGRVANFLNLYYNAPEKILINWQVTSPEMYLAEFIGFLGRGAPAPSKTPASNSGNIVDQLSNVINRAQADMHLSVANVHYEKFLAKDMKADIHLSEDGIVLKAISLKHANGGLLIKGNIVRDPKSNRFSINTVVNNVDIHEFFYSFNNFGLSSPTYQNLKGHLSASANVTGAVDNTGAIVKRSINGTVNVDLTNGALVDFTPLKTVGKFAFPFRRLNNITIPKLDAKFDINGNSIIINPMKLTSSALNVDIAGTYDMNGKDTDIKFGVPLRNPKNDSTIVDKDKRDKKRYKGIVLHLAAKNNDKGGIKIGFQ